MPVSLFPGLHRRRGVELRHVKAYGEALAIPYSSPKLYSLMIVVHEQCGEKYYSKEIIAGAGLERAVIVNRPRGQRYMQYRRVQRIRSAFVGGECAGNKSSIEYSETARRRGGKHKGYARKLHLQKSLLLLWFALYANRVARRLNPVTRR